MAFVCKLLLALMNAACLCVIGLLLMISFKRRNKCLSWFHLFHVLCLAWTTLRFVFWSLTMMPYEWSPLEFYCLYWLPSPLQYANFALLILFYITVLGDEKSTPAWIVVAYLFSVLAMMVFTVLWAVISNDNLQKTSTLTTYFLTEVANLRVQRISTAISSFLLVRTPTHSISAPPQRIQN